MFLIYAFSFMLLNTIYFKHYISWYFHLCSFGHLLSCHFYFAHLRFFFSFLRYLIINMNHKIFNDTWTIWLLSLALWSIGLLGLRIRNFGLWLETLWPYLIIFPGALEVYLKTLVVCLFCVQVIVIAFFICNLEFTRIQPLLCLIFMKT